MERDYIWMTPLSFNGASHHPNPTTGSSHLMFTLLRHVSLGFTASLILGGAAHLHAQTVPVITDAVGDFIPTYSSSLPRDADLDVIAVSGAYNINTGIFTLTGQMAGNINLSAGQSYVWGFDRGQGTARLAAAGATNVPFDSIVQVAYNGTAYTASFTDFINSANSTALPTSVFAINGDTITLTLAATYLPSTGYDLTDYTYNLWPRGAGGATGVSDFAPDNSNLNFAAVPEPADTAAFVGLGALGLLIYRQRKLRAKAAA